jgi:hypothetical protein
MKSQRHLARIGALTIVGALLFLCPAVSRAAAEIELGNTSMADGLASAFVIVRNNDQPRGYASLTVHCVFMKDGQSVGEASAQIKDLKYHEHLAERLSTFIKGDNFDRAVCTIADAQHANVEGAGANDGLRLRPFMLSRL